VSHHLEARQHQVKPFATMQIPEAVTSVIDDGLEFIYSFQPLVEPTLFLGMCSSIT